MDPRNNTISERQIQIRKTTLVIAADAVSLDFLSGNNYKNEGVLAVTANVLTIGVTKADNAELYLLSVSFAQDTTVTFSQNIKHEFDTDNTQDIYKVATNQLLFKAGEYKIGGDFDGTFWGIVATKIAI